MGQHLQEGHRITVDAPSGGVEAGDFILVEGTLGRVRDDADAGDPTVLELSGVKAGCPADDQDDFDNLAPLYWNDTDGKLFAANDGGTGDGHPFVGKAYGAKATADAECDILLCPQAE